MVKQFKLAASDPESVLAAFEEEAWAVRIDNPLPPAGEKSSRHHLQTRSTRSIAFRQAPTSDFRKMATVRACGGSIARTSGLAAGAERPLPVGVAAAYNGANPPGGTMIPKFLPALVGSLALSLAGLWAGSQSDERPRRPSNIRRAYIAREVSRGTSRWPRGWRLASSRRTRSDASRCRSARRPRADVGAAVPAVSQPQRPESREMDNWLRTKYDKVSRSAAEGPRGAGPHLDL